MMATLKGSRVIDALHAFMSLPQFSGQAELFSTAGLSSGLFAQSDRYRLFGKLVYPALAAARSTLEKFYCAENGRVAIEPVLLLGVSLLQHLDGVPDRQAVELLRYHELTGATHTLVRFSGLTSAVREP